MSEFERFDDTVWDRVFESLAPREGTLSDAEVQQELTRLGISNIGLTVERLRAVIRQKKSEEQVPVDVPTLSEPPRASTETAFPIGGSVVKRGDRSSCGTVVARPRTIQGELWYPVRFSGPDVENVRGEDLELYEGDKCVRDLLAARSFATHAALARRITMSKLQRPLKDVIYSLEASRTEFHAHQFRPLMKFLSSDRGRLLIADEVGLGKTIEAAYILQEQKARHAIDRVLVVCPASLRIKWQRELWGRFREEFEILTSDSFRGKVLSRDSMVQRRRLQAIVSLQTLRSATLLTQLEEEPPRFDLVIVDEAHHCRNSETSQHRAVRILTTEADAVVFLTATPVHIHNENLFNLLRLLLPEEFDRLDVFERRLEVNRHIVAAESAIRRPSAQSILAARESLDSLTATHEGRRIANSALFQEISGTLEQIEPSNRAALIDLQDSLSRLNLFSHVMTRTRKREVQAGAAIRKAQVLRVKMTDFEQMVYDRVSQFSFSRYMAAGNDFAARFALITLQRQLASSVHAALGYYWELIEDSNKEAPQDGDIETLEDDLDQPHDSTPLTETTRQLVDDPDFRSLIEECQSQRGEEADSKLEQLVTLLRKHQKVVLFAYFKRSLRYLERQLNRRGIGCVRIDGNVPTNPQNPDEDERIRRIEAFRDRDNISVLLSSEVGSEGLDFQFCHTLVNWDLPWNPMVVEQRIGRLDRLGQQSQRILVFNFSAPDTIEDRILERLYQRVGLFEGAIGTLEPILGQQIKELTDRLFDPQLTPADQERLIDEAAVALERRLKEERALDEASATLIGQDEVFSERLEEAKRLGRCVTPDEVQVFVRDFLDAEFPENRLRPLSRLPSSQESGVWRFPVTTGIRRFLQTAARPDDSPMQRFLTRCGAPELLVTFQNNVALNSQTVEFMHSQHPLVRAISRFYESHADRIHPVSAIQVESDAVPEGDYFFLWARAKETGLYAGHSLWAECVSINGDIHPDPTQTELLLHQGIVEGKQFDGFESPAAEHVMALYDACEELLYARAQVRQTESEKLNNSRVEARLASLQASYEMKRAETERRMHTALAAKNHRAAALFEAQLRTQESVYRHRREEVEARRRVSVTLQNPDGAGFIRVTAASREGRKAGS